MKKIMAFLFLLNFSFAVPSYSFSLFEKGDKSQIRSVITKHNKALSRHDIETVKTFYDKNYKSVDGFNLDDLTSMLQKTYSTYDNIKYKTKINSISAYDNWALVQMSDVTSATVYPVDDKKIKKEKMGKLDGRSVYVVYLKKNKDSWKIISDDILMEETSLKYGVANKVGIDLVTPLFIKNGGEYDLSLKLDKPDDIIALASLSREEVSYPPLDYQEKYRKVSETGDLARLVKANNKNLDEYAVASIGFTRLSVNEEESKARIEVLGMAYVMKRINMERIKASKPEIMECN